MKNIFDGIRVIDFSTNAAGPFSTALMADFGAEIIKIEKPKTGDDMRAYPPMMDGVGMPFFWPNRGKKSVVLDMNDSEGREIAHKLIDAADLVVESFKPGTMANFGLDYETLKTHNPALIMCSVSAYGQTGPYKDKPGYDIVAQALSGVMDLTGDPSGLPTRIGFVAADYTTGLYAYSAIVSALYHRKMTGLGQYVDVALLDCLVTFNGMVESAGLGRRPTRSGNHHSLLSPFGLFRGNGGSVIIGAPNPKLWTRLCEVMGRAELAIDPKFNTAADRMKNLTQMVSEIEKWLGAFPNVDAPLELLDKAGIPCSKVNNTNDVLVNPQLIARDMITELETPDEVSTRKIITRGNPLKFSAVKPVMKKAPRLGQDQVEVLRSIGYTDEMISTVKNKWQIK